MQPASLAIWFHGRDVGCPSAGRLAATRLGPQLCGVVNWRHLVSKQHTFRDGSRAPDTLLIVLLAALTAGAPSLFIWLRASRRIRDLEMALLARTTDETREDEVRHLLEHLLSQTDQLADQQAVILSRLAERPDIRALPSKNDQARPITPH